MSRRLRDSLLDEKMKILVEKVARDEAQRNSMRDAYNLIKETAGERLPGSGESYLERRLDSAYLVVEQMEGEYDDVAVALLGPAFVEGMITAGAARDAAGKRAAKQIFALKSEAVKRVSDGAERSDFIEHQLFSMLLDKYFGKILNRLPSFDKIPISDIYNFAKSMYNGKFDAASVMHFIFSLRAMELLSKANAEVYAVAAAVCHEAVVNSESALPHYFQERAVGWPIRQCANEVGFLERECFGRLKKQYGPPDQDEAGRLADILKTIRNRAAENAMLIPALGVIAADRLCSLKPNGGLDYDSRMKIAVETERYELPVFRAFGIHHFVNLLEDSIWSLKNPELHRSVQLNYDRLLEENADALQAAWDVLEGTMRGNANVAELPGFGEYRIEIVTWRYLPWEIFNLLHNGNNVNIAEEPSQIGKFVSKRNIPLMDVEIIIDGLKKLFIPLFMQTYANIFALRGLTIVDVSIDAHQRFLIYLEDRYRNVFRLVIVTKSESFLYRHGFPGDANLETAEETESENGGFITILKRNYSPETLPRGATVLDLAFLVHEEIGYAATGAIINGRPANIYTVLQNGDHVVITADTTRHDGVTVKHTPHVRIQWLNHVVTKHARSCIMRWLEERYEGKSG